MRVRSFDLFSGMIMTVGLAVTFNADGLFRTLLGIPCILVLPGYALVAALFPERLFDFWACMLYSVGLSIAVVIVSGLALNAMESGLQPASWMAVLGCFNLIASVLALFRRNRLGLKNSALITIRPSALIGLGLALGITGAAIGFARWGVSQQPTPGFTQFWLVAGEANTARLGFKNDEGQAAVYRIEVHANGYTIYEWKTLALKSGEQWQVDIQLPAPQASGDQQAEALLYRLDGDHIDQVYRRVTLWRNGTF